MRAHLCQLQGRQNGRFTMMVKRPFSLNTQKWRTFADRLVLKERTGILMQIYNSTPISFSTMAVCIIMPCWMHLSSGTKWGLCRAGAGSLSSGVQPMW